MKWDYRQSFDGYVDFDKHIVMFKDLPTRPSVDAVLTFNTEDKTAYIVFQQCDDMDGTNETDFENQINITWAEGLRLLGDTPLPKELETTP